MQLQYAILHRSLPFNISRKISNPTNKSLATNNSSLLRPHLCTERYIEAVAATDLLLKETCDMRL